MGWFWVNVFMFVCFCLFFFLVEGVSFFFSRKDFVKISVKCPVDCNAPLSPTNIQINEYIFT